MANVKSVPGPEYRVYMNWKTGALAEFKNVPTKAELDRLEMQQVFLCYHDGTETVFVDPVSSLKDLRYGEVELLDLKDFRSMVRKLGGESLPLTKGESGPTSVYTGEAKNKVLMESMKPDSLRYRMQRLEGALADLTETIEEIMNAGQ